MSGFVFIALVNPKSGGNVGQQLMQKFKEILDEDRVYNITDGGPRKALEEHKHRSNLRIVACGGDGTVGWILSVMDAMELPASGCRPPIGIVPLGTGNDLARSLDWGGKYVNKPLRKVLFDIAKADFVKLDRWKLDVTAMPAALKRDSPTPAIDESACASELPLNVVNNYFSVGIDAHIALQFHRARNKNPDQFTSRTRNLLFYGMEGGKDLFKQQWRNLMDHVSIVCDDVDFTQRLRNYGAHSIIFLNIKSFASGTRPWNRKAGKEDYSDGLLEVVAIDNMDLAILQAGGHGLPVTQCRRAVITTTKAVPMQIDGEPCLMRPCRIVISHHNQANMLARDKSASYALKDAEVEEWAAQTIQKSFKNYKRHKSISSTR